MMTIHTTNWTLTAPRRQAKLEKRNKVFTVAGILFLLFLAWGIVTSYVYFANQKERLQREIARVQNELKNLDQELKTLNNNYSYESSGENLRTRIAQLGLVEHQDGQVQYLALLDEHDSGQNYRKLGTNNIPDEPELQFGNRR